MTQNYVGNSLEASNRKHDYRLEPAINSGMACLLLQAISGLMATHKLERFKKLFGWLLINVIKKQPVYVTQWQRTPSVGRKIRQNSSSSLVCAVRLGLRFLSKASGVTEVHWFGLTRAVIQWSAARLGEDELIWLASDGFWWKNNNMLPTSAK